jgi:hypothetical protein
MIFTGTPAGVGECLVTYLLEGYWKEKNYLRLK